MLEEGPGNKKAFDSVKKAPRITIEGIRQAFFQIGKDHIDELNRQMLSRDKEGRFYNVRTRTGRRRRHRASAAGQTAANRTGRMRKGRGFQLSGSDQLEFGIRGAPYASFLERGTRNMEARPSLGNTVRAIERNTTNRFSAMLRARLT